MASRPEHRSGTYETDAARCRALAYANPLTQCEAIVDGKRCGKTLAEHPAGSTWDAGHKFHGVPGSPLQPEVDGCNRKNGAIEGTRRRRGLRTTRNWGNR